MLVDLNPARMKAEAARVFVNDSLNPADSWRDSTTISKEESDAQAALEAAKASSLHTVTTMTVTTLSG